MTLYLQYFYIDHMVIKKTFPVLALLLLLRRTSCRGLGAASLTSEQPEWTITIKPMRTGAKRQQSALTAVFLMFVFLPSSRMIPSPY